MTRCCHRGQIEGSIGADHTDLFLILCWPEHLEEIPEEACTLCQVVWHTKLLGLDHPEQLEIEHLLLVEISNRLRDVKVEVVLFLEVKIAPDGCAHAVVVFELEEAECKLVDFVSVVVDLQDAIAWVVSVYRADCRKNDLHDLEVCHGCRLRSLHLNVMNMRTDRQDNLRLVLLQHVEILV